MVCGTFVLQYSTAPRPSSISTSAELASLVRSRNPTMPIVACDPATWNESLMLMGRPCSGPASCPPSRMASSSRARFSASAKYISVRQLVCAHVSAIISYTSSTPIRFYGAPRRISSRQWFAGTYNLLRDGRPLAKRSRHLHRRHLPARQPCE